MSHVPNITVPDPSRPFSTFCLALGQGSLADPPGQAGRAWLTAQMVLRGAEGLSRREISTTIEGLGSVCDLSVGRDHTMLWADALTRQREPLLACLDRVLGAPTFPEAELDKLRRETLAELEAVRDDDASLGMRFFVRALYGSHPYGRPLKGTERSLPALTRDNLVACFRSWSQEGALVGQSGDVDAPSGEALAARLTRHLPARSTSGGAAPIPTFTPPEKLGGWKVILVDKPERTQTQVFMGHVALAGLGAHHPDWTALQVGQTPFGGTFTSRLSHEIREKRGWSYGAWSQVTADQRLGTFMMRFYPATKDTLPALQLTDELLRAYLADGPSDAELDAAQANLQNSFVFTVDTASRRLSELVSTRLLGHPDSWLDGTVDRLRQVTHADATRAMRAHVSADDLVVTIVCSARELEKELAAWPRVKSLEVIDWKTPLEG
ncbi:MAG: insulinase family protein [Deltaproteobacteria bacterium]|nr:insulinase family protein [Deltaproteobacteria bacterium]